MGILLSSFIREPKKTSFDGKDRDEDVLYVFRRSFITNIKWMFIAAIMAITPVVADTLYAAARQNNQQVISPQFAFTLNIFWYVITFGFIFQNFINWFFNVYIVSNKKIVDVDFHGILYKNISETPLRNVEDVTSNITGAIKVIFNYGNVYIQTSAEKREFEFENVDNPSKVRDLIADLVEEVKHGH